MHSCTYHWDVVLKAIELFMFSDSIRLLENSMLIAFFKYVSVLFFLSEHRNGNQKQRYQVLTVVNVTTFSSHVIKFDKLTV